MKNILKTFIDYSLFQKYDKEYFINNKIVPIYEDNICLKVAICKKSNLNTIKDDFNKMISFEQIDELELLFILSNIDKKISLFSLASKSIFQNSFEKYINNFLDELLFLAINLRSSDIHIEPFEEEVIVRLRVDGVLNQILTLDMDLYSSLSTVIKFLFNKFIKKK